MLKWGSLRIEDFVVSFFKNYLKGNPGEELNFELVLFAVFNFESFLWKR